MKKTLVAVATILASIGFRPACATTAQDSLVIQNQAEFQAYKTAEALGDTNARAEALESFLKAWPQTVAAKAVLEELMDLYRADLDHPSNPDKGTAVADKELSASNRLLQLDPGNLRALYYSMLIEKSRGMKAGDPRLLDHAADLARRALAAQKPAAISADEWKSETDSAYPAFHSAIAADSEYSKKDLKAAAEEYRTALSLYTPGAATSESAVFDSYYLARLYATAETKDPLKAIWLLARAWKYASDDRKPTIEIDLENAYASYHGGLDGLDDVKKQVTASFSAPDSFTVKPAPTLAERIHKLLETTPKPDDFSITDIETILGAGVQADAEKMWALFKNQTTAVPGKVIVASASSVKVTIQTGTARQVKVSEVPMSLKRPMNCGEAAPPSTDISQMQSFLLAHAADEDSAKVADLFKNTAHMRKIVLAPDASVVEVAVTKEARDAETPDFIVNLKTPVSCAKAPAAGTELTMEPNPQLIGTYDTYRKVAGKDPATQTVQIVLKDGVVETAKKKSVAHPAGAAVHKTTIS